MDKDGTIESINEFNLTERKLKICHSYLVNKLFVKIL